MNWQIIYLFSYINLESLRIISIYMSLKSLSLNNSKYLTTDFVYRTVKSVSASEIFVTYKAKLKYHLWLRFSFTLRNLSICILFIFKIINSFSQYKIKYILILKTIYFSIKSNALTRVWSPWILLFRHCGLKDHRRWRKTWNKSLYFKSLFCVSSLNFQMTTAFFSNYNRCIFNL